MLFRTVHMDSLCRDLAISFFLLRVRIGGALHSDYIVNCWNFFYQINNNNNNNNINNKFIQVSKVFSTICDN